MEKKLLKNGEKPSSQKFPRFKNLDSDANRIDTSRKFVVREPGRYVKRGDILELIDNDFSEEPYFNNLTTEYNDFYCKWRRLAYASEEEIMELEERMKKKRDDEEYLQVQEESIRIERRGNILVGAVATIGAIFFSWGLIDFIKKICDLFIK
jgi:hypothetical protein